MDVYVNVNQQKLNFFFLSGKDGISISESHLDAINFQLKDFIRTRKNASFAFDTSTTTKKFPLHWQSQQQFPTGCWMFLQDFTLFSNKQN